MDIQFDKQSLVMQLEQVKCLFTGPTKTATAAVRSGSGSPMRRSQSLLKG